MLPEQEELIELEDRFILGELLHSDYLEKKRELMIKLRDAGETVDDPNVKVTEINDSRDVPFCLVPQGGFISGSEDEWKELQCQFYISKFPVTAKEFREFLENCDIGYTDEDYEAFNLVCPDDDCPASHLSYNDAKEFCRWLRRETGEYYSLPHEVEWEKAARGVDGRFYPWGNTVPDHEKACFQGDVQYGCTVPVFTFQDYNKSPFGLVDMVGNVWEWCLDSFEDERDPHILRGGSWCNDIDYSNAVARTFSFPPTNRIDYGGLRLIYLPGDMLSEYREAYSERGVAQSLKVVGMKAEAGALGKTKKVSFKSLGKALDDAAAQAVTKTSDASDDEGMDESSVNDAMAMAISDAANMFLRKSTQDEAYTSESDIEMPVIMSKVKPVEISEKDEKDKEKKAKDKAKKAKDKAKKNDVLDGMQQPQYKSIAKLREERSTEEKEKKKKPTLEFDEENKITFEKATPLDIPPALNLGAVITWSALFAGVIYAFVQRLANL